MGAAVVRPRPAVLQFAATAACLFASLGGPSDAPSFAETPAAPTKTAPVDDWRTVRRLADERFVERLESLARRCDALDLPREAQATRDWFVPRDPGRTYVFLAAAGDPLRPAADAPLVVRQWHAKFREHRAAQAEALLEAARAALAAHEPSVAYRLLYEALRENPEHGELRRVLGEPPVGGDQRREVRASAPKIDHPSLPWRRGRYWRAESTHFRVASNHSAAAAIGLAERLEDVRVVWRQTFFSFWSREAALAARLAGGDDPLGPERRHDVVLLKDRDEYLQLLSPDQPQIGVTLGIYLDTQRKAFLYVADDSVEPTWWHEVAHQLFQESEDLPAGVGKRANIWAAEAAAIYFESLQKRAGWFTVGGQDADRLQFARYRILRDDYYLPLESLAALGRDSLQSHAEIRKLYGQSGATAHFLLDGADRRLAEPFIGYLRGVYEGRAGERALFERLGVDGAELDRRFRDYLQVTDADLRLWPSPDALRNLSLGRTAATDAGVARFTGAKQLEWLDLGFTAVGDQGLAAFASATRLRQLFLEQTKVTDRALDTILKFRDLEELDLSRTAITERGLARLGELKRLQKLHLTGCAIGDAGLAHLKSLKQLDTLDVSETQVTPEGLAELRRALPKLAP